MNNNIDPVVIVKAKRTPIGSFLGIYNNYSATKLGSVVIADLIKNLDQNIVKNLITEVIMGCVLPAGLGQAPARQAALNAGIPNTVPCTTVNKMCGSGLKTIVQAYNNILVDKHNITIAGGMENMSLAPYFIPKAREGLRLGHGNIIDHMFFDGLEDAYDKGCLMGHFAEQTAKKYKFSREAQDLFALSSVNKAIKANNEKLFSTEISEVKLINNKQELIINIDETIEKLSKNNINLEKISKLKPAFISAQDLANGVIGTVTAANSSSIADGAAAIILMRLSKAQELGLNPIAKVISYAEVANEPAWFTTAPIAALNKLINSSGFSLSDIDIFEINEAFAVVTMAAIEELKLDFNKVNVYGGACALGHPIGATGARIIVTLLHALLNNKKSLGVASLCIGGGEALALAIEII